VNGGLPEGEGGVSEGGYRWGVFGGLVQKELYSVVISGVMPGGFQSPGWTWLEFACADMADYGTKWRNAGLSLGITERTGGTHGLGWWFTERTLSKRANRGRRSTCCARSLMVTLRFGCGSMGRDGFIGEGLRRRGGECG
jgi:hypothetical protein